MASSIRLDGEGARIEWGYQTAAEVGRYRIEHGYLRAQLRTANPFRLTQSPLWFIVENPTVGPLAREAYARLGRTPPAPQNFERELLDVRVTGTDLSARVGARRPNAVTNAPPRRLPDPAPR
jgi:hypothetical protein